MQSIYTSPRARIKMGLCALLVYLWMLTYALLQDHLDERDFPSWAMWLIPIFFAAVLFLGGYALARSLLRPITPGIGTVIAVSPFIMLFFPDAVTAGIKGNWSPLGLLALWITPILLVGAFFTLRRRKPPAGAG